VDGGTHWVYDVCPFNGIQMNIHMSKTLYANDVSVDCRLLSIVVDYCRARLE
jgi:hypothetical protein